MIRFLFILICCCSAVCSSACLNPYHTRLDGVVTQDIRQLTLHINDPIDKNKARYTSNRLFERYHQTHAIEDYSDYGLQLILLGQYENARKIFLEIEHISPNRYNTAANLGTAYELLGKPDSALIWIRRAVAIYPGSHNGSEWIHIKILKFKLRKSSGCDASMLGINFGDGELPTNPMNLDLDRLSHQLSFQLKERTKFIYPKDPVVGRLFFELGNTTAQLVSAQTSLVYYRLARKYGCESPLLSTRITAMEKLSAKTEHFDNIAKVKNEIRNHFVFFSISGIIILLGFILFVWRIANRVRQCLKSRDK
jgi:hypothetical protein